MNFSFDFHLAIILAMRPATRAVQSKNMWNESEINPKLFLKHWKKVKKKAKKGNTEWKQTCLSIFHRTVRRMQTTNWEAGKRRGFLISYPIRSTLKLNMMTTSTAVESIGFASALLPNICILYLNQLHKLSFIRILDGSSTYLGSI